jgi:AcrR family transcriptional regulator
LEPVPDAVEQIPSEVAERHLRADAQRNLEAILEAAAAEFAERGLEAGVADIAKRAGVGQATIFRRFETKDDLILAVVEAKIDRIAALATEAVERKRAWDGLREIMEVAVEGNLRDRGLFEAMHERLKSDPRLMAKKAGLVEILNALVARAKAEGDLRRDVSSEDFPMLIAAAAQAGTVAMESDPDLWRRYLQLMLDGLRADGKRSRLPCRAPEPPTTPCADA